MGYYDLVSCDNQRAMEAKRVLNANRLLRLVRIEYCNPIRLKAVAG